MHKEGRASGYASALLISRIKVFCNMTVCDSGKGVQRPRQRSHRMEIESRNAIQVMPNPPSFSAFYPELGHVHQISLN